MFYRLTQNNNSKVGKQGQYYARAYTVGDPVRTDELADIMQRNSTVKRSDIKAVLEELIETMATLLAMGNRVRLDGLGSFKLGIMSRGCADPTEFNVREHIKGLKVIFKPESKTDSNGNKSKVLLADVPVVELPQNLLTRASARAAAQQNP